MEVSGERGVREGKMNIKDQNLSTGLSIYDPRNSLKPSHNHLTSNNLLITQPLSDNTHISSPNACLGLSQCFP